MLTALGMCLNTEHSDERFISLGTVIHSGLFVVSLLYQLAG